MARRSDYSVDRSKIIDATIAILEADGIDRFTLRALGKALDINAGAIYYYFSGRDEILKTAAARLLRQITIPNENDPLASLVATCRDYWRLLLEKPFIIPVMVAGIRPRTGLLEHNEELLKNAGVDPLSMVQLLDMLEAYVLGAALIDSRIRSDATGTAAAAESRERLLVVGVTTLVEGMIARSRSSADVPLDAAFETASFES